MEGAVSKENHLCAHASAVPSTLEAANLLAACIPSPVPSTANKTRTHAQARTTQAPTRTLAHLQAHGHTQFHLQTLTDTAESGGRRGRGGRSESPVPSTANTTRTLAQARTTQVSARVHTCKPTGTHIFTYMHSLTRTHARTHAHAHTRTHAG